MTTNRIITKLIRNIEITVSWSETNFPANNKWPLKLLELTRVVLGSSQKMSTATSVNEF